MVIIRKHAVQKILIGAALTGLSVRGVHATPLVFEDFNPPGTGGNLDQTPAAGGPMSVSGMGLNGTSGGIGFTQGDWYNDNFGFYTKSETGGGVNGPGTIFRTATSSVTTTVGTTVTTTNFVYPTNSSLSTLPAPSGGAAQANAGYSNNLYEASLTTPIPLSGTAGTYYFSYLLGDNGNGGADYQAQLLFDGSTTKIYSGFGYGGRDDIDVTDATSGITPFGGGNSHQASGGSYSSGFNKGTLGLVVGLINVTASGSDTVSVKIFPYTAGSTASIPVNPANISWDTTLGLQTSDTVTQLGLFMAGNTGPTVDAIRVGTAYADAVGTISPTTVTGTFSTYTGAISGAFNTTTKNFQSSTGAAIAFTPGDPVLFDDTAIGTTNVVVASGGVAPSSVTFNNLNKNYNFTGGSISGTGPLNVVGGGTVTLGNSNSYAGGVNLSNGTLVLAAGSTLNTPLFAAGAGTLNFNGGTLQASNSSGAFLTSQGINVLAGGATIDTQAFNISIGSSLLASTSSAGGGLIKIGSGALTLTGHSTVTGGTFVNAGTLNLSAGGGAGAVSGTLTINSGAVVNATVGDAVGYSAGTSIDTLIVNKGGVFNLAISPAGAGDVTGGNEGYITNLVLAGGTVAGTVAAADGTVGRFNFKSGYGITSLPSDTTSTISSNIQLRVANAIAINTSSGTTASGIDLLISGGINEFEGSGMLNKMGTGTLQLSGSNSYTGGTNVSGGKLVLASAHALPNNGGLTIGAGTAVQVANHGTNPTYVPQTNALTNAGSLDIVNNAMVINNGSIGAITAQVASAFNKGLFTGTSPNGIITSSAAASDTQHLTAVGIGTNFTAFQGGTVATTDVLLKYTYYGDANLDGMVDGSDYSRIDSAFISQVGGTSVTGWYNGDFNYDGVIDGSDYTLIDNAFNRQGAVLASQIASPTALISGGSAVPEPTSLAILGMSALGVLGRRRRHI